jgi:hypothetical protein
LTRRSCAKIRGSQERVYASGVSNFVDVTVSEHPEHTSTTCAHAPCNLRGKSKIARASYVLLAIGDNESHPARAIQTSQISHLLDPTSQLRQTMQPQARALTRSTQEEGRGSPPLHSCLTSSPTLIRMMAGLLNNALMANLRSAKRVSGHPFCTFMECVRT